MEHRLAQQTTAHLQDGAGPTERLADPLLPEAAQRKTEDSCSSKLTGGLK